MTCCDDIILWANYMGITIALISRGIFYVIKYTGIGLIYCCKKIYQGAAWCVNKLRMQRRAAIRANTANSLPIFRHSRVDQPFISVLPQYASPRSLDDDEIHIRVQPSTVTNNNRSSIYKNSSNTSGYYEGYTFRTSNSNSSSATNNPTTSHKPANSIHSISNNANASNSVAKSNVGTSNNPNINAARSSNNLTNSTASANNNFTRNAAQTINNPSINAASSSNNLSNYTASANNTNLRSNAARTINNPNNNVARSSNNLTNYTASANNNFTSNAARTINNPSVNAAHTSNNLTYSTVRVNNNFTSNAARTINNSSVNAAHSSNNLTNSTASAKNNLTSNAARIINKPSVSAARPSNNLTNSTANANNNLTTHVARTNNNPSNNAARFNLIKSAALAKNIFEEQNTSSSSTNSTARTSNNNISDRGGPANISSRNISGAYKSTNPIDRATSNKSNIYIPVHKRDNALGRDKDRDRNNGLGRDNALGRNNALGRDNAHGKDNALSRDNVVNWRCRPGNQLNLGDKSQDRNNREFSIPTSDVKMPSGKTVSVTIPGKKCYCTTLSPTKLILLRPGGKFSQLEYQAITQEMNSTIKTHVLQAHGGGIYSSYNIVSIHKVKSCCLWKKFRNRQFDMSKEESDVNQRMLFHGSLAADDIVKMGFDERHSNAGGMFGAGIYFAEHSSKSNQYVFGYLGGNGCPKHYDKNCYLCERKMLLCRVTLGKEHRLTQANKLAHPPPGFHSVAGVPSAGGLQYPEYVIYRGEQAYPEYLITYKIVR